MLYIMHLALRKGPLLYQKHLQFLTFFTKKPPISFAPGDVSHEPGGRLPLLSARPAVTLATLKSAATNFAVL